MGDMCAMEATGRFMSAIEDKYGDTLLTEDMKKKGISSVSFDCEDNYTITLTYHYPDGSILPGPDVAEYVDCGDEEILDSIEIYELVDREMQARAYLASAIVGTPGYMTALVEWLGLDYDVDDDVLTKAVEDRLKMLGYAD